MYISNDDLGCGLFILPTSTLARTCALSSGESWKETFHSASFYHLQCRKGSKRNIRKLQWQYQNNLLFFPHVIVITPLSFHPQMFCVWREIHGYIMNQEGDAVKGCEPWGWCKEKKKEKKKERRLLNSFGREGGSLNTGLLKSHISQMRRLLQWRGRKSIAYEAIQERSEQYSNKSKSC